MNYDSTYISSSENDYKEMRKIYLDFAAPVEEV